MCNCKQPIQAVITKKPAPVQTPTSKDQKTDVVKTN